MEQGYVQIYTGNGKGKTTAALGLVFRALGRGLHVRMIQFLKKDGCGEHEAARRMGLTICTGEDVGAPPWSKDAQEAWRTHTRGQWQAAKEALASGADLVVLDELLGAVGKGFITVDEVLELIDSKPAGTELVITGRNAPRELIERADLVTSMEPIKHYMDNGVCAREGIEF